MLNNQPIKGEVHLGKQTIGKMYYNHELVYENMLASGTVIWSGDLNYLFKSNAVGNINLLENVNDDWSNLKGLAITFQTRDKSQLFITIKWNFEDSKESQTLYANRKNYGTLSKFQNGDRTELNFAVTDIRITKITAL